MTPLLRLLPLQLALKSRDQTLQLAARERVPLLLALGLHWPPHRLRLHVPRVPRSQDRGSRVPILVTALPRFRRLDVPYVPHVSAALLPPRFPVSAPSVHVSYVTVATVAHLTLPGCESLAHVAID